METHIGTRIKQFREFKNLRQNAFSESAGVRQQTLSTIEAGGSEPSYPILRKLFEAFPDLNTDWLMTGNGAMLRDGRTLAPAPRPVAAPTPGLTSGAATVAEAENVLLREQIVEQREMIHWLKLELGKSPGSQTATATPAEPTNPANPKLRVQGNRGQAQAAIGFKLGRR